MTGPAPSTGTVPVGPMLSMYDPIHVGSDEFGQPFYIRLIYKNLLAAGEPGGGKSGLLNTVAAHAALSAGSRMVLFDAKDVELGMWDQTADEFVGPDIGRAIITLLRLQKVMENRYAWLRAHRRRKIEPADGLSVITSIFDEIAVFSTVLGTEQEQRQFLSLLRDLVARGRAAAMPVVAATQRPSVDIIPKSLRDLFGYRAACRCTSAGSSDIILGDGWSGAGFSATDISPVNPGEALLIAEGGIPQRIKAAYLSDTDIRALADYAAWTRRTQRLTTRHRRPGHRRRLTPPPGKEPAMFYTTHPEARQAFTRSLRELADYIDRHRAIPVPAHGATILLHADAAEDGGRAQVDYIARLLDAQVCDETATGGHYSAARAFGVIGYQITSIPETGHGHPPRPVVLPRLGHPRPRTRHLDLTLKRQSQKDPDHAHHHPGLRQIRRRRQRPLHRRGLPGQRSATSSAAARAATPPSRATTPTPPPPGTGAAPTASATTATPPSPTSPPPPRPRRLPVLRHHRQHQRDPRHHRRAPPRNTRSNAVTAARSGSHDHRRS